MLFRSQKGAQTAHQKTFNKDKAANFKQWAMDSTELQGGKAAHAYTKIPQPHTIDNIIKDKPLDQRTPQHIAQAHANRWENIWNETHQAQYNPLPEINTEHLPTITTDNIRQAAKTFKWSTGLGTDQICPRHLEFLSESTLQCLANTSKYCQCGSDTWLIS